VRARVGGVVRVCVCGGCVCLCETEIKQQVLSLWVFFYAFFQYEAFFFFATKISFVAFCNRFGPQYFVSLFGAQSRKDCVTQNYKFALGLRILA
jgi:hypothetical protein